MPEIKYEITEHLGVISETAQEKLIWFLGTDVSLRLMFVIGHLTIQKWARVLLSLLMKLKSLQSSLKISKIKYLGATRKFVALEILLREFCFLCN